MNHFSPTCKQQAKQQQKQTTTQGPNVGEVVVDEEEDGEISGFIVTMSVTPMSSPESAGKVLAALRDKTKSKWNTMPVPHYTFNPETNNWNRQPPTLPPVVQVSLALDRKAYVKTQGLGPGRHVSALKEILHPEMTLYCPVPRQARTF